MPALFRVSAPTRAILLALSIRLPSEPLLAVALSTDPSQRVPIADAGEKRSIIVKGPAKSSGTVLAELPRAAQSNENQKPKKAKRATAPPPPATVDEDDPAVKVMRNLWQQPGFQRAREEFARNAREQKQLLQDQQQEQVEDPDNTRRPPMIFTTKSKTLDEVLESASAVRVLQEANSASSLSFRSSASAGPRNVRRSESSSSAAGRSPWSEENPGRRTEGAVAGGQDEDESYSRERRILLNLQKIQNAELWNNGMPLQ